jgi:hypothetical protein
MVDRTGQNAIYAINSGGKRRTSQSPLVVGKKFHPGNYLYPVETVFARGASINSLLAVIDELIDDDVAGCIGIKASVFCGAVETDVPGVYDWTMLDAIANKCRDAGFRYVFGCWFTAFSKGSITFNTVDTHRFPTHYAPYMWSNPTLNNVGWCGVKVWTAEGMNRRMALEAAIIARFDDDPYFEGFTTDETALDSTSPDYSPAGHLAQLKREIDALEVVAPKSNVFIGANSAFQASLPLQIELMNYMRDHHMVAGGPDIRTNDFVPGGVGGTPFQRIYQGIDGGHDYRSEMAAGYAVQTPNMGGNHTPSHTVLPVDEQIQFIHDAAVEVGVSWLFWSRKLSSSAAGVDGFLNDTYWDAGNAYDLKPWMSQDPDDPDLVLIETQPGNYDAIITT